jgi:glycerophosphoryl diester phosphodiesterase
MNTLLDDTAWPYPRWIAHRGAGRLAPENTLAAFQCGFQHGFRMFECDVKLSQDEVLFLLHDTDLDRTTNGRGVAGQQTWQALSALDAGSWLSSAFNGEPLLSLPDLMAWLQQTGSLVNLEMKPTPGLARETGEAVARFVQTHWATSMPWPLLSSFEPEALQAAQHTAPHIPRAFLFETWHEGRLQEALNMGCVAVVPLHDLLTTERIAQAHALGLRVLTYTVNSPDEATALLAAGLDGLITDKVDLFSDLALAESKQGAGQQG